MNAIYEFFDKPGALAVFIALVLAAITLGTEIYGRRRK